MAENLVINGETYENVENIEMLNTEGQIVMYYALPNADEGAY
jgi:hypothetical protein